MPAGTVVAPADGAYGAPHGASHGYLLFDSRLNVGDDLVVGIPPPDVRPCFDEFRAVLPHHLGLEDTRHLLVAAPLVVNDPRLADKQLGKSGECGAVEALKVPVYLIVAQPQGEHVNLLRRQMCLSQIVDGFQLYRRRCAAACGLCRLVDFHAGSSIQEFSFWDTSARHFSACAR